MKHLKIYESYITDDLKKYFIAEVMGEIGIFEFICFKNKDTAKIQILLIYVKEKNSIKEFKGGQSYEKNINIIKNKILFQSDSIEECKEMIPYIIDQNKFNL